MAHILFVDDSESARQIISALLEDEGHDVVSVSNGYEVLEALNQKSFDLLVTDVMMPEMDGFELCRRVRADPYHWKTPILFLTSKDRPSDVVDGLDAGGDDFVAKSSAAVELPAHVRALLRRTSGAPLSPESDQMTIDGMTLDSNKQAVRFNHHWVELTPVEYRLLHVLLLNAGHPVSTERLLEEVWEYPPGTGDPKVVHVSVSRLRAKLEEQAGEGQVIRTVRGRGYMITTG